MSVSNVINDLLSKFQYKLDNNIGQKESNEICIGWIKTYIEKERLNGEQNNLSNVKVTRRYKNVHVRDVRGEIERNSKRVRVKQT
jgi:hypothetical protein